MRKSHAAGHIRSPKQSSGSLGMNMPPSMSKTPPPNVQVLSNEVCVCMSCICCGFCPPPLHTDPTQDINTYLLVLFCMTLNKQLESWFDTSDKVIYWGYGIKITSTVIYISSL